MTRTPQNSLNLNANVSNRRIRSNWKTLIWLEIFDAKIIIARLIQINPKQRGDCETMEY